jgi:hypothetical protein
MGLVDLGRRLVAGMGGAISGFREAYQHAEDPSVGSNLVGAGSYDNWSLYEARRLRYAIAWAYWQNDAYRTIHTWSKQLKTEYGLYRHVRHIYNPAHRIAEFFACHVFNGPIDDDAGDGSEAPSAVPIRLPKSAGARNAQAIRESLASLWRSSRWQSEKGVWVRHGTVMGDAPILVVDERPGDHHAGTVRLKPIHPATLKWVEVDCGGRVVAYIREETRPDPASLKQARNLRPGVDPMSSVKSAVYTQEASLEPGVGVRFKTYLNHSPHDWGESLTGEPEWVAPYPAVPLVLCRHIPIGGTYGMAEAQSTLPKIREADDQVSKLNDQIRKLVDCPWLFAGVAESEISFSAANQAKATAKSPEGARQTVPIIYASDPAAKAQALVADVHVADVSTHIQTILEDIERDHPELRYDRLSVAGALSGTALRKARQGAETKVQERRAEYDAALASAQEIALTIGGIQGYPGFAPATFDHLSDGRFRHSIGGRPVFAVDPLDRREEDTAEAVAVQGWVSAGLPLEIALRKVGWSEEDVRDVTEAKAAQAAAASADPASQSASNPNPEPATDPHGQPTPA